MVKLGIRFKIMFLSISGLMFFTLFLAVSDLINLRKNIIFSITQKSRSLVDNAESVRNDLAAKISAGLIRPFSEIEPAKIVDAVPIITAIRLAEKNSHSSDYRVRVPKFLPRNPANLPDEIEKQVLEEFKEKNLTEKTVIDDKLNAVRYFRPIRLTADCMYCHGSPQGEADVTGGIKEGWQDGEMHGAFEIITPLMEFSRQFRSALLNKIILLSVITVIIIFVSLLLSRAITRPLQQCVSFARELQNGNLLSRVENSAKDETGELADALNSMAANLRSIFLKISGISWELNSQSARLTCVSEQMNESALNLHQKSNSVAAGAEEMSVNMSSVSHAAEQSNQSTSTIAAATEEMTTTVGEIAHNAENARIAAKNAVTSVEESVQAVMKLDESSAEISKVTDMINEISEQTKLLALNATIEAARAGSAGKGFAVVANEVKELANQTNSMTEDIRKKIDQMKVSARNSIGNIQNIRSVIGKLDDIVTSIAASVEEQSVTTRDIAGNISRTAGGMQEISKNVSEASAASKSIAVDIVDVNEKSNEVAKASDHLQKNAGELMHMGETLMNFIRQFKLEDSKESSRGLTVKETPSSAPVEKLIEWNEGLSVQVSDFDSQHKKLIDIINSLHRAFCLKNSASDLTKIFSDLVDYTAGHFQAEEKLMTEKNYPELSIHKAEHQALVKKALELKTKFEKQSALIDLDLFDFLKDWLKNHILGTDRRYGGFFNSRGIN
ncbi:MAG: hypothetical protein A2096_16545 [Spirochaetes bacterium GWF1_41_5]|nr:MAG: hypothetical protein A2096_16545 [Spirochaetes bacterium GWF1_41_5]HBE01632.1 methyl-accepting chemotaxis protein [Spirochaetia bacterium]